MKYKDGTILIVDDEMGGRIGEHVQEQLGRHVICYESGREAIDAVENDMAYSLAFVDLSLPDIGGDEVINVSKRKNPNTPVVCISRYDYLPKGANETLIKPFWPSDIERIINRYLPTKS